MVKPLLGSLAREVGLISEEIGLPEYGEDVNRIFMGVFTMFKNKAPKVVLCEEGIELN
jgi:hypothetical protein